MTETGPRPDARIAFWAANRYTTLVPAIKALRRKFKGHIPHNRPEELQLEITTLLCSFETFVEALRKAGNDFNLRCPMDGEYRIGENWAHTH